MHPATPPDKRFRDRNSWSDDDLPAWHEKSTQGHGVIRLLLATAIAAALAWVMFDTAGAAFPYSPCSIRATPQYASVGHIQRFRQRTIPGQPAPRSCRRRPMDPFHQKFALTGWGRGAW
jgi:hypothetical protein